MWRCRRPAATAGRPARPVPRPPPRPRRPARRPAPPPIGRCPLVALRRSGGMKRRLSVAISLVGDPAVVYLDEPSTGARPHAPHSYCALASFRRQAERGVQLLQLWRCTAPQLVQRRARLAATRPGIPRPLPPPPGLDPASRQLLWNVIREARRDRAVVLTTHSMEEAEALCDRCVRGVRSVVSMPAQASNAIAQQGLQ